MWTHEASIGTQRDYVVICGLTLLVPLMRWVLHNCVFEPLAKAWVLPLSQRHAKTLPKKSLLKILMFSVMFSIGVLATYQESWAWDTRELWLGWPHQHFNPALKALYMVELAFCTASVGMLVLWETRRHDFYVTMLHHVVTVTLISTSFYYNFLRVGCLVVMLHDVNDIILEGAKIAKYSSREQLSTVLFGIFVVSWAVTRLAYYPGVIIRSTLLELPVVLDYRGQGYWGFNVLLCTLLVLHIYWFWLILLVIWRKVQQGDMHDVREEDED